MIGDYQKKLLKEKINGVLLAKENYLELKLNPNFCTTCGEVWHAETILKSKEDDLNKFLEEL